MSAAPTVIRFMRGVDILLTILSFVCAYFIKRNVLPEEYQGLATEPNYYVILLLIVIIWYLALNGMWVYKDLKTQPFYSFTVDITKACVIGMLMLGCVMYVAKMDISRLLIGIFFLLDVILLVLYRQLTRMVLQRRDSTGLSRKNVLIVGSRDRAAGVIESIEEHGKEEVRIIGCFEVDPERVGQRVVGRYEVIGLMHDLQAYLRKNVVDELIFAMPLKNIPERDRYLVMSEEMGINTRIIPDWQIHYLAYTPHVASIDVAAFCGIQTLTLKSTPREEGKLFVKALMDYSAAGLLLVLTSPLFLVIAVLIKLFSKGPVFYRQERLGQNGRVFELLKFRTMVNKADQMLDELIELNEADGPAFKIKNDPRIIPVIGTLLRKTSLDELPQFINVVKGEMSLVGPRPPIPVEVIEYKIWQRRRLSMKPGITCSWQIAPRRNDLSFNEWVRLDLDYIDQWSLRNDLVILLKTIRAVLTGAGR